MSQIFALIAALLMGCLLVIYSNQILKARVTPVVTTWLLFAIATTLSLVSYVLSGAQSIIGNVINVTDVAFCFILIGVLFYKYKKLSFVFTRLEIACLIFTGAIVVFWIFTNQHVYANVLLQIIMTIAFIPTMVKVWNSDKNTESFLAWGINWVATLFAFSASLLRHDALGILYTSRALTLILILFFIMHRTNLKYQLINEKHPAKAG